MGILDKFKHNNELLIHGNTNRYERLLSKARENNLVENLLKEYGIEKNSINDKTIKEMCYVMDKVESVKESGFSLEDAFENVKPNIILVNSRSVPLLELFSVMAVKEVYASENNIDKIASSKYQEKLVELLLPGNKSCQISDIDLMPQTASEINDFFKNQSIGYNFGLQKIENALNNTLEEFKPFEASFSCANKDCYMEELKTKQELDNLEALREQKIIDLKNFENSKAYELIGEISGYQTQDEN